MKVELVDVVGARVGERSLVIVQTPRRIQLAA